MWSNSQGSATSPTARVSDATKGRENDGVIVKHPLDSNNAAATANPQAYACHYKRNQILRTLRALAGLGAPDELHLPLACGFVDFFRGGTRSRGLRCLV